jgi:hypothetical protein
VQLDLLGFSTKQKWSSYESNNSTPLLNWV